GPGNDGEVTLDRSDPEPSAFRLPKLRVVEQEIAVAVEQLAVARESLAAGSPGARQRIGNAGQFCAQGRSARQRRSRPKTSAQEVAAMHGRQRMKSFTTALPSAPTRLSNSRSAGSRPVTFQRSPVS